MFNGHKVTALAIRANANGIEGGANMFYVFGVERGEDFDRGGEDLGREGDFGFGRRERVDATDGSFVERDRQALLDVTFPE